MYVPGVGGRPEASEAETPAPFAHRFLLLVAHPRARTGDSILGPGGCYLVLTQFCICICICNCGGKGEGGKGLHRDTRQTPQTDPPDIQFRPQRLVTLSLPAPVCARSALTANWHHSQPFPEMPSPFPALSKTKTRQNETNETKLDKTKQQNKIKYINIIPSNPIPPIYDDSWHGTPSHVGMSRPREIGRTVGQHILG